MEINKKKTTVQKKPSPAVVSTGCSNFKSCLSLCRRLSHPPPPPPPPDLPPKPPSQDIPHYHYSTTLEPLLPAFFRDGEAAARAYWRRARQLEHELRKLDKWLNTEKKLTDQSLIRSTSSMAEEASLQNTKLMRLADGSYLHEVKKLGGPWGRLVMQLSTLTIAENSSTAFEVMSRMTSMKMGELCKCLRESMTMGDISGCKTDQIKGKVVEIGSEIGFMEVILSGAMEKMEGLALEALLIQIPMGTTGRTSTDLADQNKTKVKSKDYNIVVVMLIQVRDPKEQYQTVGEPMIGFVEAACERPSEAGVSRKFDIRGVHVAGMKCTKNTSDGRDFLWSASLKDSHSNCCWQYMRNPDRLFA